MYLSFKRARGTAWKPARSAHAGVLSARRLSLAVAAAGMLVAFACSAAPAGAKIVTDTSIHQNFGIVPTVHARPKVGTAACNTDNTDCTALSYHNGPVQHGEKVYLLFWTPTGHTTPVAYRAGMGNWVTDLAKYNYTASGPVSVTTQYYDLTNPGSAKNFVSYGVSNGGTLVDTDAYPSSGCPTYTNAAICLTDAQLQTELAKYINAHSLPTGTGVQYYIMTPYNVGTCFDSLGSSCAYTAYCGYHNNFTNSGHTILYADMPWAFNVDGCDVNLAFGAGYAEADGIDPVVGIFSHELSETMTDPIVSPSATGWWQNGSAADAGYEIGDKCAYIYGSAGFGDLTGVPFNGLGNYNYTLTGDQYLLQLEFSNGNLNCITHNSFSPQPTFTVSPTTATHGVARTFTASVTDSNGVAYLDWNFGDGTTTRTFTCSGTAPAKCSASHTYLAAGSKSLTVTVTDKKGSTKRTSTTITVS
jgi:hypothetical protein